jgi:uncharacterized membrane protein
MTDLPTWLIIFLILLFPVGSIASAYTVLKFYDKKNKIKEAKNKEEIQKKD